MEQPLKMVKRTASEDGSAKYLLRTQDGKCIECMYMPRQDGAVTYCISSQIGCAVGCFHCATGKTGLIRNLTAKEITNQVTLVQKLENAESIRTIVFYMGMGEPFLNLNAVRESLDSFHNDLHIAFRDITLSTCGVVPGINMLSAMHSDVRLAISIHSLDNAVRSRLIPMNRQYDLRQIEDAIVSYHSENNHRVLLQYTLIAGKNDSLKDAELLAAFAKRNGCAVRLIPMNPSEQISLLPSEDARIHEFYTIMTYAGVPCKIRKMRGADVLGGCGQMYYTNI